MTSKRKQTPDVLAEVLGGGPGNGEGLVSDPAASLQMGRATTVLVPEKWEYALVSFQDYRGMRPRYLNGEEIEDWTGGPLIHDFIQEMADEGWDLVAASAGERMYGSGDHHQLYFKRLVK